MRDSLILDTFNLPEKYTRLLKEDCLEVLLHKFWIRNLLRYKKVADFIFHDKYSDDEVVQLFRQGEGFGSDWFHTVITVINKKNKTVVPLPRARVVNNEDVKLSLSQIVQYVAQANYKHLWKDAYKKYNYSCSPELTTSEDSVPFMNFNELIRELILRLYGLHVFKFGDSTFNKDSTNYSQHNNLLEAFAAVETSKAFFIFQKVESAMTVLDCINFSPAKLNSPLASPLFVIYQLLHLMRHLNNMGLVLGDITLSDIYVDDNLWIRVLPKLRSNIIEQDEGLDSPCDDSSDKPSDMEAKANSSVDGMELHELCIAWCHGALSNYDYLCHLNKLAGREQNHPTRNYVLPWVSDLSTKSGSNWRDLTKSKFRLNKGDCQLDRTFQIESNSNQVAHHVPEILSEITYYVYLARITPKSILCKYVRSQWVPGEYPASIQRLQQWTPDECIPQFYTDPSVFRSIHSDLSDLEVPSWASSPHDFVNHHRAMLESHHVSSLLHHWIDLTFGYKLSGSAAVRAKNVCLHLVDNHKTLSKSGLVQLLTKPHPHRSFPSPYFSKNPPTIHHSTRRMCDEDDQGSSCIEEDCSARQSNLLQSKLLSRSKTNLTTMSSSDGKVEGASIIMPKDYSPCALLSAVELMHNLSRSGICKLECKRHAKEKSKLAHYKQLISDRRLKQSQIIGCLIVEIFLGSEIRLFGNGITEMEFEKRLSVCKKVVSHNFHVLPQFVHSAVRQLLQLESGGKEDNGLEESVLCCQLPCAHSLLQPLLSCISFPSLLPSLFSTVSTLISLDKQQSFIEQSTTYNSSDAISSSNNEAKVKMILNSVEVLSEDGGDCLKLFVPYFRILLSNPDTDVLSAWYLFDPVSRGLGPELSSKLLLEPVLRLYDWEVAIQTDPRLIFKRIKLYHRSFLLKLTVRFGLETFLDNFIVPLVEAVGGYHDVDLGKTPCLDYKLGEGEELGPMSPLSPLEDDVSSHSTDENKSTSKQPVEDVELTQEDMFQEEERRGPKSAKSLQNLLIDNIDSNFPETDRDVESEECNKLGRVESEESGVPTQSVGMAGTPASVSAGSWHHHARKSFSTFSHHSYDINDTQHTKVCQVSGESLLWLSQRLGPVLTARHLTRNLLRMLALCYSGADRLTEHRRTGQLSADKLTLSVLHCLKSIAELYGEQLVVLQYLPHMIELIGQSKRKISQNLEGGIIGCLVLLSNILNVITDSTFSEILQDVIIRSVMSPCLRIIGSQSLPSGLSGRRALSNKLVHLLSCLVTRANPSQCCYLLQTLQRFFLLFSKALNLSPDACWRSGDLSAEGVRSKLREELESSPRSCSPYEFETCSKNKTMDELREVMTAEFAYKSYQPFANYFGENLMEQSLRNHSLIKQLCTNHLSSKQINRIPGVSDEEEMSDLLEAPSESNLQVGSFGNVVVVGNRIELQDNYGKSSSPIITIEETPSVTSSKSETINRHLRGNWVAYWEHEIGRSPKDTKLNIKQIKLQTFVGHCNSVRHIIPLASENSFMSAGRDKTVKLWSLRSQGDGSGSAGPQWTYQGHRKSILGCGFSDRCRLAVTSDSIVHIWDPWVGRAVSTLSRQHVPPINTLLVLPPPSPLALSAATDSIIRGIDLRTCSFVSELKVTVSSSALIRCLVVSPRAGWLAVGQASGVITILDLTMGTVLSQWKAHDAEILQLVAVDEDTVISSSLDQSVCVWNVTEAKLKYILKGPSEPVHCLLRYNCEVISGTTSNRLGVHSSLETGVPVYTSTRLRSDSFKGVLTCMSLLPLNRLLLLGADTGHITLIC